MVLSQLLVSAVESCGDAVAVVAGERSLSYRELDECSSRWARWLISRGVGPGDAVVVAVPRSLESVVVLWAVVKSGATFVPVDPGYPAERVQFMVADSGAVLAVTVSSVVDVVSVSCPPTVPVVVFDDAGLVSEVGGLSSRPVSYADRVRSVELSDAAWMIYTSGSTGRPKGVVVSHAGVAPLISAEREHFGVDGSSRVLHVCSPSFDVSLLELLVGFSVGASVVVAPAGVGGGPELAELIAAERVSHVFMTPGALGSMDPVGLDSLSTVVVAGEAFTPELVRRWSVPGVRRFFNAYGPTETTILATSSSELVPGSGVSIGSAIAGVGCFVLDERLRPVPDGVVGELYVAGAQVARGYHGRVGLTSSRFVADPFSSSGGRMYRTGDVVRRGSGGVFEYVGRSDFQVKLRGFGIELGEIDAVLASLPGVGFAVTVGAVLASGESALVSYVVSESGVVLDSGVVREQVAGVLPGYMVPALVVVLDEVPLTPVGKVDRGALPEPVFAVREFRAPRSVLEESVASVVASVLGVERVGLDDSFVDLGGNSLAATRVVARLSSVVGVRVPVPVVFESGSVEELAARIGALVESGEPAMGGAFDMVIPLRAGDPDLESVFFVHPVVGLAWSFAELAKYVQEGRPVYGFQSPALSGADGLPRSIDEWARLYVSEIRRLQPRGRYHLAGWSMGGVIAHEMAVQLQRDGDEVASLILLDTQVPAPLEAPVDVEQVALAALQGGVAPGLRGAGALVSDITRELDAGTAGVPTTTDFLDGIGWSFDVLAHHRPGRFSGDVLFVAARGSEPGADHSLLDWTPFVAGEVHRCEVQVSHWELTGPDACKVVGPRIAAWTTVHEMSELFSVSVEIE
nr:amino acid adenylation domain-containing protein [Rhodococcus sp. SMB37]